MIKIDDDLNTSFTGSYETINHQYAHLTMLLLCAKMEVGIPFLQAVKDIIMAVETAVDYHVITNDQELDWEEIKKFHTLDRAITVTAAALMYDDDTDEDEEVGE